MAWIRARIVNDMDETLVPLAGLAVGLLVGLTGIGGGSLMAPLLLALGVPPSVTVGTDLVTAAAAKAVAVWLHGRQGTIHRPTARLLLGAGVPCVVAGALLAHHIVGIDGGQQLLRRLIGWALLVTASLLLVWPWLKQRAADERQEEPPRRSREAAFATGGTVGLVTGLTSIGSGALIDVALLAAGRLRPQEVVATGLVYGLVISTLGGVLHAAAGQVDWALAACLLLGEIPGVAIGCWLAYQVPVQGLRTVVTAAVILAGLKMIQ